MGRVNRGMPNDLTEQLGLFFVCGRTRRGAPTEHLRGRPYPKSYDHKKIGVGAHLCVRPPA